MLHFSIYLVLLVLLGLPGVSRSEPASGAVSQKSALDFLILPTEKQASTYRRFLPVKRYLEKETGRKIRLRLGQTYEMARKEMADGQGDLIFLDPSAYCKMKHRLDLKPLAKMVRNGRDEFRSALVVPADSRFRKIADIADARLALGRPGSSSSYLIPRSMLREVGFGLDSFSRVGSLENEDQIALSVLVGDFEVGALSEEVARKYENYGLRTLKLSEHIPQFLVCASENLDEDIAGLIQKLLLNYVPHKYDRLSFTRVEDREYNIVRIMLKNMTGQDFLSNTGDTVKIGLLPLYSPITLYNRFSPLAEKLSRSTGKEVRLVIPNDFEEFAELVRKNEVDFSYQNPYIYLLLAREGLVRPLALTVSREPGGSMEKFRGVIIVRNNSRIKKLKDLRGEKIMVVSHKSAGGYQFQKLLLNKHGIDIDHEARISEGKKQESVILAVYRGQVGAGFVREAALGVVWDMINMDRIRILAKTPYYPNWPFAVHTKTAQELASQVREIIVNLSSEDNALIQARIKGFTRSDPEEFQNLKKLVEFE